MYSFTKIIATLVLSIFTGGATAFAAESSAGLPQLDISTWPTQIFWLVVTFALAYLLMSLFVTPRIASVIEDRHSRLDDDMQWAKKAAKDAENMRLTFERTLTDARQAAAEKTRQSAADAAVAAEEKNQAVAQKLSQKLEKAEAAILDARNEALKEINDVAAEITIETTARLTGIKISKTDAKKAVRNAAKDTEKE